MKRLLGGLVLVGGLLLVGGPPAWAGHGSSFSISSTSSGTASAPPTGSVQRSSPGVGGGEGGAFSLSNSQSAPPPPAPAGLCGKLNYAMRPVRCAKLCVLQAKSKVLRIVRFFDNELYR